MRIWRCSMRRLPRDVRRDGQCFGVGGGSPVPERSAASDTGEPHGTGDQTTNPIDVHSRLRIVVPGVSVGAVTNLSDS